MPQRKRIAVLASGLGTTFEYIVESCKKKELDAEVSCLGSDRESSGASIKAKLEGIETLLIFTESEESFLLSLHGLVKRHSPDVIVLAGFNKILPSAFVREQRLRIINTHPALLPCFGGKGMYGMHVHRKVIESGARISGCSVHFVDEGVDTGPIIAQETVDIDDIDTPNSLAEKVKAIEKPLLVKSLQRILFSEYSIVGKRVIFK